MAAAYQFNATFTNGSAVVTAALAAFVANAKVGDLVRGPDERLYFVSAVNSNTQITLSRNYVGTTTTAAAELSRTGSGWNSAVEANVRLARIEESLARGYTLQSDASLAIGAGSKVFTNVEPGLNILDNIRFEATSRANPANKMRGHCTYAGSTLTMTVPAGGFSGSGTFADWNLNIIGADGATGPTGGTFSTVTKGSIPVGDGANVTAEAIGANGSALVADSSQARGVRWAVAREVLTANRTYYVRTDGTNSNDGLTNSAGGAFLTVQKAVDVALAIDMSIYAVTIQIGAGTFGENVVILLQGNSRLTLNGAGYDQTQIGSTTGTSTRLVIQNAGSVAVQNLALSGGAAVSLWVRFGSFVRLAGTVRFNAASARHIGFDNGAYVESTGASIYLNGNAPYFLYSGPFGACVLTSAVNVITEAARTFTDMIFCAQGSIGLGGSLTWNQTAGAITARKFNVTQNGVLNTSGNVIPGATAGITASGGQAI